MPNKKDKNIEFTSILFYKYYILKNKCNKNIFF